MQLDIVVLGLTLSSSWGNGHAVTYRGLLRELARAGHRVHFLERDVPWYASHRDPPDWEGVHLTFYDGLEDLREHHTERVAQADLVIVGSFVPQGIEVARWVLDTARGRTAFYDIDTPVTVAALRRATCEYVSPALLPRFDLYLSFTGGPLLRRLESEFGVRRAAPLHCSVDPDVYRPVEVPKRWNLGYLGTYSADRQPSLERLLFEPMRTRPELRGVVGGPQYPDTVTWPENVEQIAHVPPVDHPSFYGAQHFTLNLTRADMIAAGWSPSIRLFEAAACGVAILTDAWEGLDTFFTPGHELLIVRDAREVRRLLEDADEEDTRRMGLRARARVMAEHTAAHRAQQLVELVLADRRHAQVSAEATL